ncbi:MAG: RtcB family protein [Lachnospiraceae bacterium]|nr:RtcB family protein [Ruminococcus sp.]MCM1276766.1 RtcB family protein [Lachnospiraceae bacterium]
MFQLQGKYGIANVYATIVENEAAAQIVELLNQPFVEGEHIAIMPDVHAGAGCTIGTTMTITDKVVPNLVGVDIGCGMKTVKLKEKSLDFNKLDEVIRNSVPSGSNIRSYRHKLAQTIDLKKLKCVNFVNMNRAKLSIGTLGGGNHFIEVDKDDNGNLYLVIHSGSRHLGVEVAKHYQNEAYKRLSKPNGEETSKIVNELKAAGKTQEIQSALAAYNNSLQQIPKDLAYCEGDLFSDYIHDMKIVQEYAMLNRQAMAEEIINGIECHIDDEFTTIHNYIDIDNMILRKGAVSAQDGEILLIPINMRDGSLICKGKGNPDYNYSAPHGAGRLMSRSQAKRTLTAEEYRNEMQGVFTTTVGVGTIDEAPMAYKPLSAIIENLTDTVEIVNQIKPVYNYKASE